MIFHIVRPSSSMRILAAASALWLSHVVFGAQAGSLVATEALRRDLQALADGFDGRVGLCAQDVASSAAICVNGDQRFSMQSVMKLIVGAAALEAVDRETWRLDDPVVVRRENLSLHIQPLAELVAKQGEVRTTIGDLVARAVIESDSAATDILIERLGGPQAVQAFLERNGVAGVRIDRDERRLQSDIAGLTWRPDYVDADVLERAKQALPETRRDAAFAVYLKDERDTATPKGMASFLVALASGRLLSASSTAFFMDVMSRTATFPDRLRAGAPAGWTVGHKTGTSQTWKGVTAVTNDVGILTAPDGGRIAVAAFVADTRRPANERASVIARATRAISAAYR